MCVLGIGYEAESECPEETIAISSNLSISIDIFVHFFIVEADYENVARFLICPT